MRAARAEDFAFDDIAPLNTIALEVVAAPGARLLPRASGLPDALFEHDGQITKREARAITLAALAPRRGELLWDVGAGCGSVAIEWMLCDPANRAFAIEQNPERAARIARNAAALGVPGLEIVEGEARRALRPAAAQCGFRRRRSKRRRALDHVFEALAAGGRLVVNAVTLEGQGELARMLRRRGGDLVRVDIAHADPIGRFHGWRPSMPLVQWRMEKPWSS